MSPGTGGMRAAALGADDGSRPQLTHDFDDFRGLLEELSPNISMNGMFFATDEPHPAGTEVDVDVRLAGGSVLLGRGEVVWSSYAGNGRPAGLGIRLDQVNDEGRTLIQRIVEVRTEAGQETFQLEPGADAPSTPVEVPSTTTAAAAGDPRETAELRADLERVRSERDALRADLEARQAERDEIRAELETHHAERDQLRAEVEQLRQEREKFQAELERGEQEREKLAPELEAAQAAESELKAQLSEAQAQLKEALAARDELAEQQRGAEKENRNDRARLEEALLDKLDLEHKLGEKEEVIARFQEATGHAAADRDRLEADKKALEAQIKDLEASVAKSDARRDELELELADAREEAEKQGLELEAAHETRAELQADIERAQTEVDATREQIADEARRAEEARSELEGMESKVAEAHERAESLEGEAAELRTTAEKAESERNALATELEVEKKAALKSRKLAKRVRAEHEKLQEDLAEALARVEELEALAVETAVGGDRASEAESASLEPIEELEIEDAGAEVLEEALSETDPLDEEVELEDAEASNEKREGTGIWASLAGSFGRGRQAEEDEPEDPAD